MDLSGKTPKSKLLIAAVILVIVIALSFGIYYTYFQFNQKDVKDYINEEVEKYPLDQQAGVYNIISSGVQNILSRKATTNQVLIEAKRNGTPREMELVHAAIMEAKSFGYLD